MIVIGIGVGRCGTASLASLLNKQNDAYVTHEAGPMLPYERTGSDYKKAVNRYSKIRDRGTELVGDVSLYNLWWGDVIREVCGDVKWVCMKRDKDEVVESFVRKIRARRTKNKILNHWTEDRRITVGGRTFKVVPSAWDKAFPLMRGKSSNGIVDLKKVIAEYYDFYYSQVNSRLSDVLMCDVGVFNDLTKQKVLFDFIGICKPLFRYGIKENKS